MLSAIFISLLSLLAIQFNAALIKNCFRKRTHVSFITFKLHCFICDAFITGQYLVSGFAQLQLLTRSYRFQSHTVSEQPVNQTKIHYPGRFVQTNHNKCLNGKCLYTLSFSSLTVSIISHLALYTNGAPISINQYLEFHTLASHQTGLTSRVASTNPGQAAKYNTSVTLTIIDCGNLAPI